jgi:CRISPR/Cas system-associated exonuclease Cas4 (RecB family)
MGKHHEFSPSKLHRLFACPGSYKLSQGIVDEDSEAAAEGRLLHERVVSGDLAGLTDEQAELVALCRNELEKTTGHLLQEWTGTVVDSGFSVLTEGTADAVCLQDDRAVLYDWKFGRGEVDPAHLNLQLAAYALMVHQAFGVEEVLAVLVQPRLGVRAEHTFRDFDSIMETIREVVKRCQSDTMELAAGSHCRYCQAAPSCPVVNRTALAVIGERTSEITDPTKMAAALELAEKAGAAAKALEDYRKRVQHNALKLMETVEIPGWRAKEGANRRSMENLESAFGRVQTIGISGPEFVRCCTISIPDLEKLAEEKAAAAGRTKKEGKGELLELLADLIEKKPGAKTVVPA